MLAHGIGTAVSMQTVNTDWENLPATAKYLSFEAQQLMGGRKLESPHPVSMGPIKKNDYPYEDDLIYPEFPGQNGPTNDDFFGRFEIKLITRA